MSTPPFDCESLDYFDVCAVEVSNNSSSSVLGVLAIPIYAETNKHKSSGGIVQIPCEAIRQFKTSRFLIGKVRFDSIIDNDKDKTKMLVISDLKKLKELLPETTTIKLRDKYNPTIETTINNCAKYETTLYHREDYSMS